MYDISIKVENYKCFVNEAGFDRIKRINLIVGRNNSGKSSLLDIIEMTTKGNIEENPETKNNKNQPISLTFTSSKQTGFVNAFLTFYYRNMLNDNRLTSYGDRYNGKKLKWNLKKQILSISLDTPSEIQNFIDVANEIQNRYTTDVFKALPIPLSDLTLQRVAAERDLRPESDNSKLSILSNGLGITNAIQRFLNDSRLDRNIIEGELLDSLNLVYDTDAIFTRIACQTVKDEEWEVFLEEQYQGWVALSQSGSGLKTVIAVLANLILVPKIENKKLDEYVFGFEELENSIHPALLRRLNKYIDEMSKEHGFIYFLTTHSNVSIDQFSKQEDAQIIHVTQKNGISTCNTVRTYFEHNGILDDLDIRASDLLQANGVIWVEGPSDRIYLNRWINLWSEGKYQEGSHYQIIFYGGRLLSHLSSKSPEDVEKEISMLNVNRNAIVVIDSDKKSSRGQINKTKRRLKMEFERIKAFCWITKGKEIENYLPQSIVSKFLNKNISKNVGEYESFFDYLDREGDDEGKKYLNKKPLLAERLVPLMSKKDMKDTLDLDKMMTKVYEKISSWNK